MTASRVWHGGLALTAGLNVLLQVVLTTQADGAPLATRLVDLFSYFTLLSNLLVTVSAGWLARRPAADGRLWRILRVASLACITLTGVVYVLLLRPSVHNQGWAVLTDVIFHYVVPVGAVLGWLVFGPRARADRRSVAWSLLVPLVWLAYTMVRGAVTGRYPYGFLDAGDLGYGTVLVNALGMSGLLVVVAALVAAGDRLLPSGGPAATTSVHLPTP
jgi:hypothetical protein